MHWGDTALTIAVRHENADAYDMVRALLERGANANHSDAYGLGPLYYAARAGNLPVVELLVEQYGAAVNVQPEEREDPSETAERQPLYAAYENSRPRVASFLEPRGGSLRGSDIEALKRSAAADEVYDSLMKEDVTVEEIRGDVA